MASEYCVTLHEEKSILKSKVVIALWSPKTDIIAIGSRNGTISLHRYTMNVTWEVHSPELGAVILLAWRPDGKVIAVAYASGRIHLLNLSDGTLFHSIQFDTTTKESPPIKDMIWIECDPSSSITKQTTTSHSDLFPAFDALSVFSDDLFSNQNEVFQLSKRWLEPDSKLSILCVYLEGLLKLYGCGVYEFASIDLGPSPGLCLKSFVAHQLTDMFHLTLTHNSDSLTMQLNEIDARMLSSKRLPLKSLSMHVAALLHCKQILLWSLKQLKNAWEDTLLEMDTKLTTYSRERLRASPTWSLRNELLEIILFGHISVALKNFFTKDWTPTSIRRAGITMLKAYETMKAITFQQLQYALMRLIFETSAVLGCVRNKQDFGLFAISESSILQLLRDAGSALQKTQELHLVVEHCSHHLGPFFKWLYGVAIVSTKLEPDKNTKKVTSEERDLIISFVTEQLRPVMVGDELKSYQIELVEQYIRSGGITKPADEMFGINAQSEHYRRSKLKDTIPIPQGLQYEVIPDGVFAPTNSSLADLIEVTLATQIEALASSQLDLDQKECGLLNKTGKIIQLLSGLDASLDESSVRLCCVSAPVGSFKSSFGDNLDLGIPELPRQAYFDCCSNTVAFVPPRGSLETQSDCIIVYSFESKPAKSEKGSQTCLRIEFDNFVNDDNVINLPYRIQDVHFFGPDTLIVLVYRECSLGASGSPPIKSVQWFIFIPLAEALAEAGAFPVSFASIWNVSSGDQSSSIHTIPVSRLVVSKHQVHPLPKKPFWLAVNGNRKILFVMFENSCRVYIMETFDGEQEEEQDESIQNTSSHNELCHQPMTLV